MARIFNRQSAGRVGRNVFDLSHERKLSCNMGRLVPILCQEVVPGDTFRVNSEIMLRLAPMLAPIMHRVNIFTHYFYVPNRLVWNQEDFEAWITGKNEVDGNQPPIYPRIRIKSDILDILPGEGRLVQKGSLWDYLGLPELKSFQTTSDYVDVSALPFRAYQLIYNEWYRDQDLQKPVEFSKASGIIEDAEEIRKLLSMKARNWEKDYFTSARPWAQKGEEVHLPIPDQLIPLTNLDGATRYRDENRNPIGSGESLRDTETRAGGLLYHLPDEEYTQMDVTDHTFVEGQNITLGTINELRRAVQLQKWLERNARSGSRYTELLLAHFGVKSSDARLQRPEYLGGGRQPISVSEVLQTSQSTEESPQGEMTGHGISIGKSNRFKKFFEEHGWVIGIVSILPRTAYQQGIPKQFQKFDKFDHYWPEFAHIGEQEIKTSEIWAEHVQNSVHNKTFGYAPRYSEYKFINSTVHGDFKDELNHWHMGRILDSEPGLDGYFVEAHPTHRIFNVINRNVHKWSEHRC